MALETPIQYEDLLTQIGQLRSQLCEALDTIDAIKTGEVDAVIVNKGKRREIYTIKNTDNTYRMFIEKMAEGAVTINKNGCVLYCNSSFAEMLNIPLNEVLGEKFETLFPFEFQNSILALIDGSWSKDGQVNLQLERHPEEFTPVLLSMRHLEKDGISSLSAIITDLSVTKEFSEQKKEIEKRDEFITIASHELRTPVTSIKGYIQLLRFNFQQEGNHTAANLLTKADAQINKLTTLISDILDVQKIEHSELSYEKSNFDFINLVNEIATETAKANNSHSFNCSLQDSCQVYGDRNRLGQVIANFLDNAIKYSPKGSTVNIIANRTKNTVRLSVKDAGIGIPKEQHGKVFERFFRVKGEKENTYGGLGLGLYISAEIIKRHNGIIGFDSEIGHGAEFYFELPVS